MRKMLRTWGFYAVICASLFSLSSCLDDDDYNPIIIDPVNVPNMLVTVKPTGENSFYMQLDDSTTLYPTNLTASPFGMKEVRALASCIVEEKPANGYTKAVAVLWMDSILTKQIAPDLGLANDSIYGTDPVDIVKDWVTIAEDGYLTLRFRTNFGFSGTKHFVNLLMNQNPDNPYEVEFRHNAYGDVSGSRADGLVAFKLSDLPDTNGKNVKLKLVWKSYDGMHSTEFDYCSHKSLPASEALISDIMTDTNAYLK